MKHVNIEVELDENTICGLVEMYVKDRLNLSEASLELFEELVNDAGEDPNLMFIAAGKVILNESMLTALMAEVERVEAAESMEATAAALKATEDTNQEKQDI